MDEIILQKQKEKVPGMPFSILSNRDKPFIEEDFYQPSQRDFYVIFWFKQGMDRYYIDFLSDIVSRLRQVYNDLI